MHKQTIFRANLNYDMARQLRKVLFFAESEGMEIEYPMNLRRDLDRFIIEDMDRRT